MDPRDGAGMDADLLAAEYVLGVLDARDLRVARRRLREDGAFASDVAAWEAHLLPWIADVVPMAPPADAWARIVRSLGLDGRRDAAAQARKPDTGAGFWRGLAFGGLALAAVCTIALVSVLRRPPEPVPAPPPVVRTELAQPDMAASIAADDGRAMLVASIDSRSGAMTLAPAGDMQVPADRAAELWVIPAGGVPQSLGVIDPTRAQSMTVPAALRGGFARDAVLAVSIEPLGGSPTGQPTGPVVAKGSMRGV